MKANLRVIAALLAAICSPVNAAPFLSSAVYLVSSPQPTEFLVSIDDLAEVVSAAVSVRQVSTITLTAYDAATTYKVTIGGVDVTQVGTGGTLSQLAATFATTLNNSADGNFAPITWSSSGAVITGKHDTGGTAFTPTTSVSGGTGTIGAPALVTASTGKALYFDIVALPFGTHTATVKAQNATTTSAAATFNFETGVEVPNIIVIPGGP